MKGNLTRVLAIVATAAGAAILASCNGTSSTPNNNGGNVPPPSRNSRVYVTDASGNLASNPNSPDRIDVFTISSLFGGGSGVAPVQEIMSGSFSSAVGVAVDSSANIYIVDNSTASIQVFHNNASGTAVSPYRTITSTAMGKPAGIALDSANNIYVTVPSGGSGSGAIVEFSASQSGSVTPIKEITGASTGLNQPFGITVHNNGNIFVTNNASNTVEVFLSGANGNSTPARVISGTASGLNSPWGIVVDPSGNIYVANFGSLSSPGTTITVYGPGASPTPIRTITGSNAGIIGPVGLALDASQNLYVAMVGPPGSTSQATGEIAIFPPNANGNVAPLASVGNVGFAAWGMAVY
ncbi:MAG: NHL repeat-containing protein [Candidatus Eremiobacteraeota bacterium]|nr:NHL repeat-containing protein [Candidatus Eremiobacteraeota bacterium]